MHIATFRIFENIFHVYIISGAHITMLNLHMFLPNKNCIIQQICQDSPLLIKPTSTQCFAMFPYYAEDRFISCCSQNAPGMSPCCPAARAGLICNFLIGGSLSWNPSHCHLLERSSGCSIRPIEVFHSTFCCDCLYSPQILIWCN